VSWFILGVVTPDPISVTSGTAAVSQALALDLTQGPLNDLCSQTISIAMKLFIVFALIALIIEAFGHGPEHRRDYGGVVWRAFVVLLLLKFYAPIFGSVIATTQAIADQFKPMDANEELSAQTAQYFANTQQLPLPPDSPPSATLVPEPSWIGTKIYESSIHLIITLGQAVFWAFGILARIALLLFYVIGPLALVASLPRASRVGTRWFGQYVGVACWPILGAIVVRIVLAIGVSGLYSASALGHVCVALALGLCALAVPVVATALVGGSVTTAAQHGFKIAQKHVSGLASTAVRATQKGKGGDDANNQSQQSRQGSGSPSPQNSPNP
jgi:hypothetical protein